MNFVQAFARELQRPQPQPERLALAIAGWPIQNWTLQSGYAS